MSIKFLYFFIKNVIIVLQAFSVRIMYSLYFFYSLKRIRLYVLFLFTKAKILTVV